MVPYISSKHAILEHVFLRFGETKNGPSSFPGSSELHGTLLRSPRACARDSRARRAGIRAVQACPEPNLMIINAPLRSFREDSDCLIRLCPPDHQRMEKKKFSVFGNFFSLNYCAWRYFNYTLPEEIIGELSDLSNVQCAGNLRDFLPACENFEAFLAKLVMIAVFCYVTWFRVIRGRLIDLATQFQHPDHGSVKKNCPGFFLFYPVDVYDGLNFLAVH